MDFISDFEDRVVEVDKYFQFILVIENVNKIENISNLKKHSLIINGKKKYLLKQTIDVNGEYLINLDLRKILKATAFLILYNLIEGSITSALNEYFNSISSKGEKYKNLKPAIKNLWIKYKYKAFANKKPDNIVSIIDTIFNDIVEVQRKEMRDAINNSTYYVENYAAYIAETGKTDISGNIDARKIRDLASLYGFKLPRNTECDSLLKIKSNRNKLAHGEATFTSIGRESIEDIIHIKDESIKFTRSILKAINKSIQVEAFMKKPSTR